MVVFFASFVGCVVLEGVIVRGPHGPAFPLDQWSSTGRRQYLGTRGNEVDMLFHVLDIFYTRPYFNEVQVSILWPTMLADKVSRRGNTFRRHTMSPVQCLKHDQDEACQVTKRFEILPYSTRDPPCCETKHHFNPSSMKRFRCFNTRSCRVDSSPAAFRFDYERQDQALRDRSSQTASLNCLTSKPNYRTWQVSACPIEQVLG